MFVQYERVPVDVVESKEASVEVAGAILAVDR